MRDAFGGVFMFNLFIVFIFIYVAFSAVSLTYAKAFKLKNSLISYIEEQEIISLSLDNKKLEQIDKILQNASYYKTCDSIGYTEGEIKSNEGKTAGYCHNGVVIQIKKNYPQDIQGTKNEEKRTKSQLIVYEVIKYADWNLGVLNKLLALGGKSENSEEKLNGFWTIVGEAKVVARDISY